jgi:predicted RNase H-like HicB family nuclease
MSKGDKYIKLVEWSDEDGCFIGGCPELFYAGCHGTDSKAVFAELCDVIEETVALYERKKRPLPEPMSGREFVNAMQRIA